jgi:hypothetical protein
MALQQSPSVLVQPRVLAQVNGKTITTADVVKRLDRVLKMRLPELMDQPQEKYQFYMAYWRNVLNDLVDTQLIMADAEEKQMSVTDSEIREEMYRQLGLDLHSKLVELGMTYDEAWEMTEQEMIVQRMLGMMCQSKAMVMVTPTDIYQAYQKELAKGGQERLRYRVVTLRSDYAEVAAAAALRLEALAAEKKRPIEEWGDAAKDGDERINAFVSEEYDRATQELSESHAKALAGLEPGQSTGPVFATSPKGEVTYRLFHLVDHQKIDPPSFAEVQEKMRYALIDEALAKETDKYLKELRQRYHAPELVARLEGMDERLFALK